MRAGQTPRAGAGLQAERTIIDIYNRTGCSDPVSAVGRFPTRYNTSRPPLANPHPHPHPHLDPPQYILHSRASMNSDAAADFEIAIYRPFAYFRYQPSLAAAIVFAVLFALTTTAHAFQLVRQKTWYFVPLLIGGVRESGPCCPRCCLSANRN